MSSQDDGRLPASVYRRRRIVVGLAALAVLVVVILLISAIVTGAGSGSGSPSDKETKSASADESPSADASDDADASLTCDPAVIVVTPVTDKSEYQAGENPMLSMTITNTGASACTFPVGTDTQLYSIVSGPDPIWNSRDCQTDPQPAETVLEPGVEVTTTPFAWTRVRSGVDNCGDDRPQVTAGGGTYRLSVALGSVESAEDVAFLLF